VWLPYSSSARLQVPSLQQQECCSPPHLGLVQLQFLLLPLLQAVMVVGAVVGAVVVVVMMGLGTACCLLGCP
jgi:hypothetical protein